MTADQKVPPTRDWVRERAACSVAHLFAVLTEVVDSDMKAANALAGGAGPFKVATPTRTKVIVIRERRTTAGLESDGVVFELLPGRIAVKDSRSQRPLFVVTPAGDPVTGECKFAIGDDHFYAWQISQRALEALFFQADE